MWCRSIAESFDSESTTDAPLARGLRRRPDHRCSIPKLRLIAFVRRLSFRHPDPLSPPNALRIGRVAGAGYRDRARTTLAACGIGVLALALGACEPAKSGEKESSGEMFGLFKGKKVASVVAPEVGAPLQRQQTMPANVAGKQAEPAYGYAVLSQIDGKPPAAKFVDEAVEGHTTEAYRIAAHGGQPPLTVLNILADNGLPACEIWEMDAKQPTRFAKRRLAQFDADQAKWTGYAANGATLLPGGQVLVGMYYVDPMSLVGFYLYDSATNTVRPLGVVQPDWTKGAPFIYADTIQIAPDAAAVIYHTDKLLLGSERYANLHDHVLLFSPRHPHGIEALDLGLDDGNVRRWGVVGHTLWFDTVDARDAKAPAAFVWSLDISRLL
jgi:hypothetical protein